MSINLEPLTTFTHAELNSILTIWESSVRATHHFLTEASIVSLKPFVTQGAQSVQHFIVAKDNQGSIQGFMGIHEQKIEMLFIDDVFRGQGIGKHLVHYGVEHLGVELVDVNEQNPQGVGFYEHMGFTVISRSAFDDQGNPFPILHMKLET